MSTWLECKASPGQFSGELAVRLQAFDGSEFSLFAPEEYVDFSEQYEETGSVDAWLRVEIVESQDELNLVRLPRQPLGNGQFVTVRASQLRARANPQEADCE